MLYVTLDTCVWLEILKIDLHTNDNVFEEICYWIENKFLTHITPENIIREWDRNKVNKTFEIINQIKSFSQTALSPFKANKSLISTYQPDIVEDIIKGRIARVDSILKINSEIAKEDHAIYDAAVKRNLSGIAPNHSADSFRDTINILTIITYTQSKGYSSCYFSTINYKDFSIGKTKKHDLHPELVDDFRNASLQYVYFDVDPIGEKLLNVFLRPNLPSFQDYLKDQANKELGKILEEKKEVRFPKIENPDKDFLENIKYIDFVLSKTNRTKFDEEIIKLLIEGHDSYKQYFFKNVGNDGMV